MSKVAVKHGKKSILRTDGIRTDTVLAQFFFDGAESFTAFLKINLLSGSESIEWNGNAWANNCKFEGKELSSLQTSGLFHFYHLYNACFTN